MHFICNWELQSLVMKGKKEKNLPPFSLFTGQGHSPTGTILTPTVNVLIPFTALTLFLRLAKQWCACCTFRYTYSFKTTIMLHRAVSYTKLSMLVIVHGCSFFDACHNIRRVLNKSMISYMKAYPINAWFFKIG